MDQQEFNRSVLEQTDHRPWPMRDAPWVMTQTWHDLLFAHWTVDKSALALKIPAPLELDLFEGQAWLGIVPFYMTNVGPRGVPSLPWVSEFPELNVRTYVTLGGKPGVYFFSLDAGNAVAVGVARGLFHLPYYLASMRVESRDGAIHYASRRSSEDDPPAEFVASYRATGPVFEAREDSLDYFLTERYCLYTVDRDRRASRVDIHHAPWPLQPATAVFEMNTMADPVGVAVGTAPPRLHFASRQDVVAWLPERATVEVTDCA
jgi:uncharacterized protein YqjF (DUF2071 family)